MRRAPSAERRAPSAERRAPSAERRAPSAETAARLRAVRRRGYPIGVVVYPDADHGMVHVERRDGARVVTGFEPGHCDRQAAWIHARGGTPDPRSTARARLTGR